MPITDDQIFSIRDIIDSQLETREKRRIGRVSDIEAIWQEDGKLVLSSLVIGPQALAGRIASPYVQSFVSCCETVSITASHSTMSKILGQRCGCVDLRLTIPWDSRMHGLPTISCVGFRGAGTDASKTIKAVHWKHPRYEDRDC